MGLLSIDLLRNKAEAFPNPQHMSINWKGIPSQAKKEDAVNGLWADPLKTSERLDDLFGAHPPEKTKAQPSFLSLDPLEDLSNAPCFLPSQSTRSNGLDDRARLCLEDIFPEGESTSQSPIGSVPIPIVRVLGENGLDEDVDGIGPSSSRNPISPLQKLGDRLYLSSQLPQRRLRSLPSPF